MHKILMILSLLLSGPVVFAAPPVEYGVDRPGMDYTSFNLARANPLACQTSCNIDYRCKAWTYVRPGVQGPTARCWLKHAVPAPVRSTCCSSGRAPQVEYGVDRPGMDFQNFNLSAPNPDLCRASCFRNGACRAWTYVRPGVQGPTARCWLKYGIPTAARSACCSSGLK